MTEPDVEDVLRRYRPAGPPAELRARVVERLLPVGRAWPWAIAAAVLLSATLGLQFARAEIQRSLGGGGSPEQQEFEMVVELLGGDNAAEVVARRLLWERELTNVIEEPRRASQTLEQ
jgi:hypothetical protein